ncbi:predicted protein [Uncinocarpus reesii 1704]|uniref:Amino acid permease/ SLC12A domain-containing protein n=1 Tax=Uncinocarpus reesii (strain UAMH 1704) TaxID=336963 RepID=C4JT48_UNCRE|nr:uncharacterized protein UREG_05637 [Uncinocarpus reesii 1704]EEP80795.1 predicted protein [Uncinocarpus reesii 1704]
MARAGDAASLPHNALSSAVKSIPTASCSSDLEKRPASSYGSRRTSGDASVAELKPAADHTHRKLKPRHIQLIGIGGTIGTALFVQIGKGLMYGGPASLFIAFTLWYVLPFSRY